MRWSIGPLTVEVVQHDPTTWRVMVDGEAWKVGPKNECWGYVNGMIGAAHGLSPDPDPRAKELEPQHRINADG